MARKAAPKAVIGPDWFIQEWMATLRITQADLIRETGWSKGTANDIYHGRTNYYREILNLVASVLKIQPFELLMHPDEAFRLRRLRETALEIAADNKLDFKSAEPDTERLEPKRRAG